MSGRAAWLLLLVAAPASAQGPSRAEHNYAGVVAGTIAWTSLSAAERAEVVGIARSRPLHSAYDRRRRIELADREATPLDAAMLALKCGPGPDTASRP